jgi:hypothetical protein
VFGNHLSLVPSVFLDDYGPVAKFLVDATKYLEKHITVEGLFRKSGSVARQKELRVGYFYFEYSAFIAFQFFLGSI